MSYDVLRTDDLDSFEWSTITKTFSDDGILLQQTIVYDDGRISVDSFTNGVMTSRSVSDPLDARTYSTIEWAYDNLGSPLQRTIVYDDGRVSVENYTNGAMTSRSVSYPLDAPTYSSLGWTYDEFGVLLQRSIVYRDGRTSVDGFTNGVMTSRSVSDPFNNREYSTLDWTYDNLGAPLQRTIVYDDGRIAVESYANGVMRSRSVTDPLDARDWTSIDWTYDSLGAPVERTIVYDDGRTLVINYPNGGNKPPTWIVLDNLTVDENDDGAIIGQVTVTDTDDTSHTLSVDDARFEIVGGILRLRSGESLDFETEPSVTLTLSATDSAGSVLSQSFDIVITDFDEAPVAVDDTVYFQVGAAATFSVTGNDSDPEGDVLTTSLLNGATNGTVIRNANGTFTYTPDAGFTGTDSFTYTVTDPGSLSDTATVTVIGNHAPVARTETPTTFEGYRLTGNVLNNDTDIDGDTLTVIAVNGSAANLGQAVSNPNGTLVLNADGSFTFDAVEETGNVSVRFQFTYTISDGHGGTSSVPAGGTYIVVLPSNDPAVFSGDLTGEVTEDNNLSGGLLSTSGLAVITDPDGSLRTVVADALNVFVAESVTGTYGSLVMAEDGNWTYSVDNSLAAIQALGVGDTLTDTITVTQGNAYDLGGATQDIVITINGANDAPVVAAALTASANEGTTAFDLNLLAGASDPDTGETATLTVTGVTYAIDGGTPSATPPTGLSLTGAILTVDPADPAFDHLANGVRQTIVVSYQVQDIHGATVDQTETITITGTNDAPVAIDDEFLFTMDTALTFSVTGNDYDPDGDALQHPSVLTNATHGSVVSNIDGTFTYTPDAGFSGTDSFTYMLFSGNFNDGTFGGDSAVVTFTAIKTVGVFPVDDTPFV